MSEPTGAQARQTAHDVPRLVKIVAIATALQGLLQVACGIWFLTLTSSVDTATQGSPMSLIATLWLMALVLFAAAWGFPRRVKQLWAPVLVWNIVLALGMLSLVFSPWWIVWFPLEVLVLGIPICLVLPRVRSWIRNEP